MSESEILLDTATFVIGLIATGLALIFHWTDRRGYTTRALALSLFCLGLRLSISYVWHLGGEPGGQAGLPLLAVLARLLEGLAIVAGIEWARRIGVAGSRSLRRSVSVLFRVSQLLALVYVLMTLLQLAVMDALPKVPASAFLQTPPLHWAILLPLLGTSMLLSAIGIVILLFTRSDPVESVRLRALALAAPFLLAGLVTRESVVPITMAIGLLVLLSGSIRYLIIQTQRGQLMSQFLSPDVERSLRLKGAASLLQRERRELSVVMADLRGFTRYARVRDSGEVVALLERYYQVAGRLARRYGATVKDHAGDGLLLLVGAPMPVKQHALQAARLALALSAEATALLREAAADLGVGVGVATGSTTVGAIQGAGRLEYVAVGTAVNLAARLCQRAEAGEVLADEYTQRALPADSDVQGLPRAPEPLKGFEAQVAVYALAPVPVARPASAGRSGGR